MRHVGRFEHLIGKFGDLSARQNDLKDLMTKETGIVLR